MAKPLDGVTKLLAGAVGVAAVLTASLWVAAIAKRMTPASAAAVADAPPAQPVASVHEKTVLDAPTLAAAFAYVRPRLGQVQVSAHSAGCDALVTWASARMRWADVAVDEDETNYGMVQKDIEAARGKRLCISGTVVEIHVDKSTPKPVYDGIIQSAAGNLFAFAAVGSSGAVVASSLARLCTVVVDLFDYTNSMGGMGHAVDVIGMFDLPENRPPAARVAPATAAPVVDCGEPFVMGKDGKFALKPGCDRGR